MTSTFDHKTILMFTCTLAFQSYRCAFRAKLREMNSEQVVHRSWSTRWMCMVTHVSSGEKWVTLFKYGNDAVTLTAAPKRFRTCRHSQARFGAFAFLLDDLAEQPGYLLGAASVDGQPVTSMTVVVDHLNDSQTFYNIREDHRYSIPSIFHVTMSRICNSEHTSMVLPPHLMVSLSSLTLLRWGRRPDQSPTMVAC